MCHACLGRLTPNYIVQCNKVGIFTCQHSKQSWSVTSAGNKRTNRPRLIKILTCNEINSIVTQSSFILGGKEKCHSWIRNVREKNKDDFFLKKMKGVDGRKAISRRRKTQYFHSVYLIVIHSSLNPLPIRFLLLQSSLEIGWVSEWATRRMGNTMLTNRLTHGSFEMWESEIIIKLENWV
jgi:ribosomal protein L34